MKVDLTKAQMGAILIALYNLSDDEDAYYSASTRAAASRAAAKIRSAYNGRKA